MSGKHSYSFGKKCICYFNSFNELNFMYKVLCNVLTNSIAYLHGIFHQGAKARILKTNSGQNSSKYFFFKMVVIEQQTEIIFITFTYKNIR